MTQPTTILTTLEQVPLLQAAQASELKFPVEFQFPCIGLRLCPISRQIRSSLIDAAKKTNACDDVLVQAIESQTLAMLSVPMAEGKASPGDSIGPWLFRLVGDRVLRSLLEVLQAYDDYPPAHEFNAWYTVKGSLEDPEWNTLKLTLPDWIPAQPIHSPPSPLTSSVNLWGVRERWDRWSKIVSLERILELFRDPGTWTGTLDAGNANIKEKTIAFAKSATDNPDLEIKKLRIPTKWNARWFREGVVRSFRETLDREFREERHAPSKNRLRRALQLFWDSFRLHEPYQAIILLTASLESLFTADRQELTYQLKSRIGWLLHPDDQGKRVELADLMGHLYGFRSTIVHGDQFDDAKSEEIHQELLDITRRCLRRIVEDDTWFEAFWDSKPNVLKETLKRLGLGIFPLKDASN